VLIPDMDKIKAETEMIVNYKLVSLEAVINLLKQGEV